MKTLRPRSLSCLLGVLLLLLCACRRTSPAPAPDGPARVTIGYSRLRISLPLFAAQSQGIFRRHGLDVDLAMYDTAQPMMQALVEGRLQLAGYTALPITYNGMIRSGTRLRFLTAIVEDQNHRLSYLLRRKPAAGQAAAIRTLTDLRGRRVGILPTSAYRAWLEAVLEANGVNPQDVTIQSVEPLLQVGALASGGIDALFTNDPAATAAIVRGVAEPLTDYVEVPRHLGEPFLFGSFNVRDDWARAHPREYAALSAALDEAVVWVNTHQTEARRALAPFLPEAFRAHVDRYPDARFLPDAELRVEDFTRMAQDYQRRRIIPGPVDLTGLVGSGLGGR